MMITSLNVFTLLVFSSLFLLAHGSCPSGFDLVRNGQCRGLYGTYTLVSFSDTTKNANQHCSEIDGLPVIIHDEEDQAYWVTQKNTVANEDNNVMAIGLVCNTVSKQWQWADGSAVDYKPAEYAEELDNNCQENCSWTLRLNGLWNIGCNDGSLYTEKVFCTTQLLQPARPDDDCDSFQDDVDDGVCYQIGETVENWQQAQANCEKLGANLASVHNQQENSFIRRLAVSKGAVSGVFLGGTLSGKGSRYGWIDGSAWDYDNFYPGFPISGLGDCLAMDTEVSSGQWVNTECSSKMAVACQRKQSYTLPTCASGPWSEGQTIYSPGFPYDALVPCDYILEVVSGKKVELEIIVLEANECCDHLVMLDGYIGNNVIANLTGEMQTLTYKSSSNFVRVSWQPNGGVNVRGMQMTFRGV